MCNSGVSEALVVTVRRLCAERCAVWLFRFGTSSVCGAITSLHSTVEGNVHHCYHSVCFVLVTGHPSCCA